MRLTQHTSLCQLNSNSLRHTSLVKIKSPFDPASLCDNCFTLDFALIVSNVFDGE